MRSHHPNRVLVIGHGAIGTAALPLLLDRLPVPLDRITILDQEDRHSDLLDHTARGLRCERLSITKGNYADLLGQRLTAGDLLIDLTSYIDTLALVEWCQSRGVMFLNSSVERWQGEEGAAHNPEEGLLYPRLWRFHEWMLRNPRPNGPTAVVDHGANPGLVSHFVKQGLQEIAGTLLNGQGGPNGCFSTVREALDAGEWALLAEALGVRVIQISELDSQSSPTPRPRGEFQSTWSASTMHEEALTLSELCWGTHEGRVPKETRTFDAGPRHMVSLDRPGVETWVRSWTPGGEFPAMVIGHDETYTIGEHLTVLDGAKVRYRPTVYFAYRPFPPTLESLQESVEAGSYLQDEARVVIGGLTTGRDQLGCLLMGHPLKSWWIGSLLSVEEARALVCPEVNATTLQVAASLAAGLEWLLANPLEGVRLPDDLPHEPILKAARPYLGPFVSRAVEWAPKDGAADDGSTAWKFPRFRSKTSLAIEARPRTTIRPGVRSATRPSEKSPSTQQVQEERR
ncbi:MAG: saccharopine dehydrogenase NADP-binding domain-containing protein [Acidobacteria bacterium]|nr:saccharopine dehydrogenase NADP-binding domain-containing protein [Acidobacteriota bacterium]